MRDWFALENDISLLQSQPCLWPASLASGIQKRFLTHNQYVLEKLTTITRLAITDDEKEERLRRILAIRWKVICNSSVDYTLNPDFPANQACLKIASFLAKEGESVCKIVMPTITQILGTGFSLDDIKSASEDANEKFIPNYFLTCVDDKSLIALVDLFSLARANTNHLFPSEENNAELIDITAEDRERLHLISGKESHDYFNALSRIHLASHNQKLSVGFSLKALQKALMKSSKKDKGSEEVASIAECRQPIFQFYQLWLKLPIAIKDQIKSYKVEGATFSLESYLLCLFLHVKEQCPEIEISEAEYQRVCAEKILPCTHQIALQLGELLAHHADLFNMLLSDSSDEADTVPDAEALELLSQQFERSLKTRLPLLGWQDQRCVSCLPCFEIITRHCLDQKSILKDLATLATVVKTIEELAEALIVLPISYWESFFTALNSSFVERLFSSRNAGINFPHLLTHLPLCDWISFFDAFYAAGLDRFMNTSVLGVMLYDFPESEWSVLTASMKKILDSTFVDGMSIVYLFISTPIDHWEKIYGLFSQRIEAIFKDPAELITAFKMIHLEEWTLMAKLFKNSLSEHMKHNLFLEGALTKFHTAERLLFLKRVAPYLESLSITPRSYYRLLRLFNPTQQAEVLLLLGASHFRRIVKTDIELAAFLSDYTADERVIFLSQIPKDFLNVEVGAAGLSFLLKRFPECEGVLLRMFKMQLPQILSTLVSSFSLSDNFQREISHEFITVFKILSLKTLPVILSSKNMPVFFFFFYFYRFSFLYSVPDPAWIVYQSFKKEEHALMAGELTPQAVVMKKIEILNDFIRETVARIIPRTPLYDDLLKSFGKDFFSNLHKYMTRYHAVVSSSLLISIADPRLTSATTFAGNSGSFSL